MTVSLFNPTGFLWKGLLLVALSIFIIAAPGVTIELVMVVLGSLGLLAGIVLLYSEYRMAGTLPGFTYRVAEGVLNIIVGVIFIANPKGSAGFLLVLLGIGLLIMAGVQLVGSLRLPAGHASKSLMLAGSILTGLLAVLLLINPFGGAQALVTLLGFVMLALGILLLVLAGKFRQEPY